MLIMHRVGLYIKNYRSEKSSMKRLREDIIDKSTLIELKKRKVTNSSKISPKRRAEKIHEILKIMRWPRGGQNYDPNTDVDFEFADNIQKFVIQMAIYLKKKELKSKLFKFIFSYATLVLRIILAKFNIELHYMFLQPGNQGLYVVASMTGGATGFILSWYSIGAFLFFPPTILSAFIVRSTFQQILFNVRYSRLQNMISKMVDEAISEIGVIAKAQKEIQKKLKNSQSIKLESLNWNRDPSIKRTAQQLWIFENPPLTNEQLYLDTLDPSPKITEVLEELGIDASPDLKPSPSPSPSPPRTEAKIRNFRDFVQDMEADADISDFEPIPEPEKIRIRDLNKDGE